MRRRALHGWLEKAWASPPGKAPRGTWLLSSLESFYRAGLALRRTSVRTAPIPVISIGSLWVGGVGKTPVAGEVARIATEAGETPAIVLRGYRGSMRKGVARVPADAGAGLVRRYGDEACLHARDHPARVYVARRRVEGVRLAAEEGATLAVLDDGMQHRSLARDLEIVTLPSERPLANRRLLPRGPLREPASALRRADLILLTYASRGGVDRREVEGLSHALPGTEIAAWRALLDVHPFAAAREAEGLAGGRRVALFCGIGTPGVFRRTVEEGGYRVAWLEAFDDHHDYRPEELDAIWQRAERSGVDAILTTRKDAVRLGHPVRHDRPPLYVAHMRIHWERGDEEKVRSALLRTFRSCS